MKRRNPSRGIDFGSLLMAGALAFGAVYAVQHPGLLRRLGLVSDCLTDEQMQVENQRIINDMEDWATQYAPVQPTEGWAAFRQWQVHNGQPDPGRCPHSVWGDLAVGRIPRG